MSDIFFSIVCGFIFLIIQQLVWFDMADLHFSVGVLPLLIIYIGFMFSFSRGFIAVIFVSLMVETFSFVTPIYLVVPNLILFACIQVLGDQIMAESYLTKSFWVIVFGILNLVLTYLVIHPSLDFPIEGHFWLEAILNVVLWAAISIPLFIFLDYFHGWWQDRFAMKKANLTGADLYQVKSK